MKEPSITVTQTANEGKVGVRLEGRLERGPPGQPCGRAEDLGSHFNINWKILKACEHRVTYGICLRKLTTWKTGWSHAQVDQGARKTTRARGWCACANEWIEVRYPGARTAVMNDRANGRGGERQVKEDTLALV